MKCLMCEAYSLKHICKRCREHFLAPTFFERTLQNGLKVYSFYSYDEIETLLKTKHTELGYYIYRVLAQCAFRAFSNAFEFEERVAALPVDDHNRNGYSHTAILAHTLQSVQINVHYGKLRALSEHTYSGESLKFRRTHPRDFRYKRFSERFVWLVDDIVTTGTTLTEATQLLEMNGKKVLGALVLSSVNKKESL